MARHRAASGTSGPDTRLYAKLRPRRPFMAGLQHLQVTVACDPTLWLDLTLRHSLCLSYLGSLSSMEMSVLIFCFEGGKMYIRPEGAVANYLYAEYPSSIK